MLNEFTVAWAVADFHRVPFAFQSLLIAYKIKIFKFKLIVI